MVSVNQTPPCGGQFVVHGWIALAPEFAVGIEYCVITPDVVIRPILLMFVSVNHRAPSVPDVILFGPAFAVGKAYCVKVPAGVIRAILFIPGSVIHRLWSEPVTIAAGWLRCGSV